MSKRKDSSALAKVKVNTTLSRVESGLIAATVAAQLFPEHPNVKPHII